MNTDEHRSVLLSRKSFASCQGFSSAGSWERTHPACRMLDTLGTLEACAPRDGTSAFSAVRFFWLRLSCSVFICGFILCSLRVPRYEIVLLTFALLAQHD